MNPTRKPRGVRASQSGLKQLEEAKAAQRNEEGKPLSLNVIAEKAYVGEKTLQRFLRGDRINASYAFSIIEFFNLDKDKILEQANNNDGANETIGVLEETIEELKQAQNHLKEELLEKENEIDLLRFQTSASSSELSRLENEKQELEILVNQSDEPIHQLEEKTKNFQVGINFSHEAAQWLSKQTSSLIADAVEFTLKNSDSIETIEILSKDLNTYLYLVYHSLILGSHNLLHQAIIELKIPLNLQPSLYIDSLKFIRDERLPTTLPDQSLHQIKYYLNFLITEIERFSD